MDYHEESQSVTTTAVLSVMSIILTLYLLFNKNNKSLPDDIYLKISHSKRMYYEH